MAGQTNPCASRSTFKRAAADFYEENRRTFLQQTGGVASFNLKEGLIERFASVVIKNTQYADYLNCNQGLTETIEGYTNQFKKLFKQVDPNVTTPVANVICQYMVGINPSIAPLVYVRGPVTLQAVVDIAKSIEAGFRII